MANSLAQTQIDLFKEAAPDVEADYPEETFGRVQRAMPSAGVSKPEQPK